MTILTKFVNPELVKNDDYKFSQSGIYFCPPTPKGDGKLDVIKEYVNQLPLMDEPSVFGLNSNAKITVQQKETKTLMDSCVAMAPRTGGSGGGKSNDEIADDLAKVIEAQLPEPFLTENAGPTTGSLIPDWENCFMKPIPIPPGRKKNTLSAPEALICAISAA